MGEKKAKKKKKDTSSSSGSSAHADGEFEAEDSVDRLAGGERSYSSLMEDSRDRTLDVLYQVPSDSASSLVGVSVDDTAFEIQKAAEMKAQLQQSRQQLVSTNKALREEVKTLSRSLDSLMEVHRTGRLSPSSGIAAPSASSNADVAQRGFPSRPPGPGASAG